MNTMTIELPGVTLVPEDERMDFLPDLVGLSFLEVEPAIFALMDRLCEDYHGGMWDFLRIDSGGGYIRPQRPEGGNMRLRWADNYSDETVSPDAAGIVATLFALNRVLAQKFQEGMMNAAGQLEKRYYQLLEFSYTHPESSKIAALID